MKLQNHFMLDIETLGTEKDCLVLSIAVVKFNESEIIDTLELFPDLMEQENKGRKIGIDTLIWWMKNTALLESTLLKQRKSLTFCHFKMINFFHNDLQPKNVWAKSPSFDLEIIKNLFKTTENLWKYSQEADVRTCDLKLKQRDIPLNKPTTAHDPLSDALAQTLNVQKFLTL